jgi:hypothetical protein
MMDVRVDKIPDYRKCFITKALGLYVIQPHIFAGTNYWISFHKNPFRNIAMLETICEVNPLSR